MLIFGQDRPHRVHDASSWISEIQILRMQVFEIVRGFSSSDLFE
jgi:hypothetical protein